MRVPARRTVIELFIFLFLLVPSFQQSAAAQAALSGGDLVLQDGVVDLRANARMRQATGRSVGSYPSVANLQVGSLFITPDNSARRVVSITTRGNTTTIETDTPPIQDVVAAYYLPDQTVSLGSGSIVPGTIQPGVTILDPTTRSISGPLARSLAQGPTWMGTDTNSAVQGGQVIRALIDLPIKTSISTSSAGCPPSGCLSSAGVSGEVRLKGTLTIIDPQVSTGMVIPSIHVKWVTKHLFGLVPISIPEFYTNPGYIHASLNSAEQLDAQLTGTENLGGTFEYPLFQLEASTSSANTDVGVLVSLKVQANGQVSVDFSIDEYARLGIWGSSDLAWPFIPHNVRSGTDYYYNFAAKPTMSATAKVLMGPLLQSDFSILGISIMDGTMWGGLYTKAAGMLQASDIVGYDENIGSYGSSSAFSYSGNFEVGGFLNFGVDLASIKMSLVNRTWPFLQLSGSAGGTP